MFFFHWLSGGGTSFGPDDHVNDEHVFAFELTHDEGEFATLSVQIRNPNVGLLSSGRKQWVWFSWKKPDNSVVPLFHGRLIAIPEELDREIITLVFHARPSNFVAQKKALANSLKVLPYWDAVWIDKDHRDDDDAVLEARSARYHIGRTDKLVTISDIIIGEAGTFTLGESDVFHESLQISYDAPPIQKVSVEATVTWEQHAQGTVDYTRLIEKEFAGGWTISSYTWQGLMEDWPNYGDDIGGGWTVFNSHVTLLSTDPADTNQVEVTIDPRLAPPDFEIEDWWADSPEGYDYWYDKAYEEWLAEATQEGTSTATFYEGVMDPTFVALYQANRTRKEILTFDVAADTQALTTDDEPVVEDIKISSDSVVDPINGVIPIGKASARTYFGSDRGKQSIDYLFALVRAKILASARAVTASMDVPFHLAVQFSCRHDIIYTSPKLPGNEIGGKIISYGFGLNGDDGVLSGRVTIGCTIGYGGTLTPGAGDPTYVVHGHVVDHQYYAGASLQPIAGEIEYQDFIVDPNDDDIDFDNMTAENTLKGTFATALFSFTSLGTPGATIIIAGRTYTLMNALTGADQVLIGPALEITAMNLAHAINREEDFEGVYFGAGTVANAQVSAEAQDGILRVTARVGGTGGNSIAVSGGASFGTWGSPTLQDGSRGIHIYFKPAEQAALLNGQTFGSVSLAIDVLKEAFTEIELALKPVSGPTDDDPDWGVTNIHLVTTDLKVPKTIDLEAV